MSYKLEGVTKVYGSVDGVIALSDFSLDVEKGEFVVLLGPSGCGKSTALRCIAGLESVSHGRVCFDDRIVVDAAAGVDLPPDKRQLGMVFQSYALWPHMTVHENISYPLKVRKLASGEEINERITAAARMVDCDHLLGRYPGELSGGQQQRVALARGLVARPELVLFDEPLSNLDALLRFQVREELHKLHTELRFAAIYVTHDQAEALSLADRIVIMRDGLIDCIGTPELIYSSPPTEYAASFLGMSNVVEFHNDGRGLQPRAPRTKMGVDFTSLVRETDRLALRFRPSEATIQVGDSGTGMAELSVGGEVVDRIFTGDAYAVRVMSGETSLSVFAPATEAIDLIPGATCTVTVKPGHGRWYGADGQRIDASETATT